MNECDCTRHKERTAEEIQQLTSRLNRIEGQIRGIGKMVQDNRYCIDIYNQVSAVQAALTSFNRELLNSHIKSCIIDDIRQGSNDSVDELCDLLNRTIK